MLFPSGCALPKYMFKLIPWLAVLRRDHGQSAPLIALFGDDLALPHLLLPLTGIKGGLFLHGQPVMGTAVHWHSLSHTGLLNIPAEPVPASFGTVQIVDVIVQLTGHWESPPCS